MDRELARHLSLVKAEQQAARARLALSARGGEEARRQVERSRELVEMSKRLLQNTAIERS